MPILGLQCRISKCTVSCGVWRFHLETFITISAFSYIPLKAIHVLVWISLLIHCLNGWFQDAQSRYFLNAQGTFLLKIPSVKVKALLFKVFEYF